MRNIEMTREGDMLLLRMKIDSKTIESAPFSSTGKTKLVATTGGAAPVPDLVGVSVAVNLTAKPR